MQSLVVENGKLVVYTDNGKITEGNVSAQISGDFVVDAKLVKSIMSEKLNLPLYYEVWKKGTTKDCRYIEYLENVSLINSDEVMEQLITKHVNARKAAEAKYERVIEAINEFNKSRRFYERKINTFYL